MYYKEALYSPLLHASMARPQFLVYMIKKEASTAFGTMDSGIKFISLIYPQSYVGGSLTS